jgi:hypothetical protein
VSMIDRASFGQMWRDRFAAPYNQASFERIARRYFNSLGSARFYAIFSVSLAIVMFVGAFVMFAAAVKSRYLEAYGIETPGRILNLSFHTDASRKSIKWKKLDYEFNTSTGAPVRGQLDRPVEELTNLPEGDRFTVLYLARLPNINIPRGVESNFGIMTFVGVVLLALRLSVIARVPLAERPCCLGTIIAGQFEQFQLQVA